MRSTVEARNRGWQVATHGNRGGPIATDMGVHRWSLSEEGDLECCIQMMHTGRLNNRQAALWQVEEQWLGMNAAYKARLGCWQQAHSTRIKKKWDRLLQRAQQKGGPYMELITSGTGFYARGFQKKLEG